MFLVASTQNSGYTRAVGPLGSLLLLNLFSSLHSDFHIAHTQALDCVA